MNISVIGAGYVGLVTAACLAENGHNVICMDVDSHKIEALQQGKLPIYEPGLQELTTRNIQKGSLRFTTDLEGAVQSSLLLFITVNTPSREDGSADLTNIYNVAQRIASCMKEYKVIVLKSTAPPGTSRKIRELIAAETDCPFDVIVNPEFLKQGDAVNDFLKPDRVVLGVESTSIAELMKEIYAPFVRTGNPILVMSPESAEMTKYAANAMLAARISLMNEIAQLCELVGADVESVRQGVGADKRIGSTYLFAGLGYGGSCFPKDIKSLIHLAQEHGTSTKMLQAIQEVNQNQRLRFVEKIHRHFKGDLKGRRIAVWGLSFKPQTDDVREAPSLTIIEALLNAGAEVQAYDPKANAKVLALLNGKISCVENAYAALKAAEALLLITEWNEFRNPDFALMKAVMKQPVIFDGRNIYDPKRMRELGFIYYGIGRP